MLTPEQQNLANAWYAAYRTAEEAKRFIKAEQEARKALVASFDQLKEGINTFDLGLGYQLKINRPINRKLDEANLARVEFELSKAGIGIETLVSYKPELKLGGYRQLTDQQKELIDFAIIQTTGSVSVEWVQPKSDKLT